MPTPEQLGNGFYRSSTAGKGLLDNSRLACTANSPTFTVACFGSLI